MPPKNNHKETFLTFVKSHSLKRERALFEGIFGKPVWWAASKPNGSFSAFKGSYLKAREIWKEAHTAHLPCLKRIFTVLQKRRNEKQPSIFKCSCGLDNIVVPVLLPNQKILGYLGLSHVRKGITRSMLDLLSGFTQSVTEGALKEEELTRLSDTIRPRAIALSTIHTVHRIINSTLNLDELLNRIARLSAQVLHSERCSIFLLDASKRVLILKSAVGYPKRHWPASRVHVGHGLEGRVAKGAHIVLRSKVILVPLIDEDIIGVITVARKKDPKGYNYFDQEILNTLAEEAVIAIKNAQLYEEQKKVTLSSIHSLAAILEKRLPSHYAHSPSFIRLILATATELKLPEEEVQALHYAAILKDVGKIDIPDEILKKPTRLTGEEYQIVRQHPLKGAMIIKSFESLGPVVPIILHSHERFDGTGYPEGKRGEAIPLGARILSVVSAFEAIITGRPHRTKISCAEALNEIKRNSGSQFDPKVVDAFCHVVIRKKIIKDLHHHDA